MNYKQESYLNKKKFYFCLLFSLFFTIISIVLILNPNLFSNKELIIKKYCSELNNINTSLTKTDKDSSTLNIYKNQLSTALYQIKLLKKEIYYINCDSNEENLSLQQLNITIDNYYNLINFYSSIIENNEDITDSTLSEGNILKDTYNTSLKNLSYYDNSILTSDKNLLYFNNLEKLLTNKSKKETDPLMVDDSLPNSSTNTSSSSVNKILKFLLTSDGIDTISNLFK